MTAGLSARVLNKSHTWRVLNFVHDSVSHGFTEMVDVLF
jgi:hypothetical protein